MKKAEVERRERYAVHMRQVNAEHATLDPPHDSPVELHVDSEDTALGHNQDDDRNLPDTQPDSASITPCVTQARNIVLLYILQHFHTITSLWTLEYHNPHFYTDVTECHITFRPSWFAHCRG